MINEFNQIYICYSTTIHAIRTGSLVNDFTVWFHLFANMRAVYLFLRLRCSRSSCSKKKERLESSIQCRLQWKTSSPFVWEWWAGDGTSRWGQRTSPLSVWCNRLSRHGVSPWSFGCRTTQSRTSQRVQCTNAPNVNTNRCIAMSKKGQWTAWDGHFNSPDRSFWIEWKCWPVRTRPSCSKWSWRCRPGTGNCRVWPIVRSNSTRRKRRWCQSVRWPRLVAQSKWPNPIADRWCCRSKIRNRVTCPNAGWTLLDLRVTCWDRARAQSIRVRSRGRPPKCQTDERSHRSPRIMWLLSNRHTLEPNDVSLRAHCSQAKRKKRLEEIGSVGILRSCF